MNQRQSSIHGFTLIELMIVIVIMAIMASLVLMNIGGVDQRKAMQARELFIMDLQRILRESNDQGRILALDVKTATDVSPFQYQVIEYIPTQTQAQLSILDQNKKWQNYQDFPKKNLPPEVSFTVQAVDQQYNKSNNEDLTQSNAPKLIWLGNGDVKPVNIQFYFEQKAIGDEIKIDHLGKINEN